MFNGDKALRDRFLAVVFSALAKNPDVLQNCTPISIVQSVKDAASLGLDATGLTGEGAIIRYGDSAQFQPMWRGYVKRIRNSGKVVDIDCQIVFMNDSFNLELGTNPSVWHKPILVGEVDDDGAQVTQRGDYRGCYAWALMPSGKYIIEYLTTADINAVRDRYSQAAKRAGSPWDTAWTEMARKTVIKRLAKRLPGEAVDSLIVVEARNDQAVEALGAATAAVNDGLADVRRLALKASGAQVAPSTDPEAVEPLRASDVVVGAVRCNALNAALGPCVREPHGDGVNHRNAEGETWAKVPGDSRDA